MISQPRFIGFAGFINFRSIFSTSMSLAFTISKLYTSFYRDKITQYRMTLQSRQSQTKTYRTPPSPSTVLGTNQMLRSVYPKNNTVLGSGVAQSTLVFEHYCRRLSEYVESFVSMRSLSKVALRIILSIGLKRCI